MKKIIAFDLDGTLSPSKQELEQNMAELLMHLLQEAKVAIISGGSMTRFEDQLSVLLAFVPGSDKASDNLLLLPTSGTKIFSFDRQMNEWKLVSEVKFPEEIKPKVKEAFENLLKMPELEIPVDPVGPYIEDRGSQITFSALGQDAPNAPKAVWDPDQSKRQKIKKAIEDQIGDLVEVGIAGTTSIDILPKGDNKATGLAHLLKYLDLNKEEMLFVGDAVFPGGNDYPPKAAGIETIKVSGPEETAKVIGNLLQLKDGA